MTAWWSGDVVPFDLESDDRNPAEARIIQWYGGHVQGGRLADQRVSLVKPERDIPDGAVEVHGISTERAAAEGVDREEAVREIALWLADHTDPATPVVGHNLAYDCTLLDREMRRLGIGSLGIEEHDPDWRGAVTVRMDGRQIGQFWVIDTMVLDKAADPFRPGPRGPDGEKLGGGRKLAYVAELFGVPIRGDAHAADADALAAARLAFKLSQRADAAADYVAVNGDDPMAFRTHPFMRWYAGRRSPLEIVKQFAELGSLTLPELHHRQVRWARKQAEGLRDYFIESGEGDPTTVDGSWPIRPLCPAAATDISTDVI